MILGTGSNAAFLERADRVHHWEGERHGEKNVIIDIEWGAFGDKGDSESINMFRLISRCSRGAWKESLKIGLLAAQKSQSGFCSLDNLAEKLLLSTLHPKRDSLSSSNVHLSIFFCFFRNNRFH